MKQIKSKKLWIILAGVTAFLVACNNDVGSTGSGAAPSTQSSKYGMQAIPTWSVDGIPFDGNSGGKLSDGGWHLLTLTVPADPSLPLAVGGIGAYLPASSQTMGQQVNIQDINCNAATIPATGGSCSVYIQFSYDHSKNPYASSVPFTGMQIYAQNSQLPALLFMSPVALKLNPQATAAGVRNIQMFENKCIGPFKNQCLASGTVGNMNYQTLLVQNNTESYATTPTVTVNTIYPPSNNSFTLVARGANSSDPVYGTTPECIPNMVLQPGTLCTLVYKAEPSISPIGGQTTITATETSVAHSAPVKFPLYSGFTFTASYVQKTPNIPAQTINGASMNVIKGKAHTDGTSIVADQDGTQLDSGTLTESGNFYQMGMTYNLEPNKALQQNLQPYNGNGNQITVNYKGFPLAPVSSGEPLLLALNNGATQYNSFTSNATDNPVTAENSVLGTLYVNTTAPLDSHTSVVSASVLYNRVQFTAQNPQILLSMYNGYNGISAAVSKFVDLNGSDSNFDSASNSSATWHNNLTGSYSSSWVGDHYQMNLLTYGQFFNLGCANNDHGACATGLNGAGTINIYPPSLDYYEYLSQALPAPTSFIAKGGQSYAAAIGAVDGTNFTPNFAVTPSQPPASGFLSMSYNYSNGQSANNGSFAITLNQGDKLDSTNLTFTPSTGYVLSQYSCSAN